MQDTTFTSDVLKADGNHEIPVYLWEPRGTPAAVIQIFHGLGEHAARYGRFAGAAVDRGYAVCAHDHRGHGPHAELRGYFASNNGWQRLVADGHQVTVFMQQRFAGQPIVLLGHSMGSYVAQSYAMRYGNDISALILSGSTHPPQLLLVVGRLLARILSWRHGKRGVSPLLDQMFFGDFNKAFEPSRTEYDWLSRQSDEVDKYVSDPMCGGPYTTGLWIDLLHGLREISTDAALRRISPDLPILISGGSEDPVGGENGMSGLYAHYEKTGHTELSKRIYAGGRHEMLNETNRDAVTDDWLRWVADVLSNHQP